MLLSSAAVLLALSSSVVAGAPFDKRWWGGDHDGPWWSKSSESYVDFGKRFPQADSNPPSCDLASATMPQAPTALPSPAPGLSLSHVAIGRGTQNFTCDTSNPSATPVADGALATLFNVTCMAADQPDLLSKLPGIAIDLPVPSSVDSGSPVYQAVSGHHYFVDLTTPFFNLDTQTHDYGTGAFKKANASNAPANAIAGQNGQGYGATTWLKLDAADPSGQIFQEVYRVNTAGGLPPPKCQGQPSAFQIPYAAEYWLFSR